MEYRGLHGNLDCN